METKVLKVLMKLQSCQILLSEKGIHTHLSTNCNEHGCLELTAYTHNEKEEIAARAILNEYKEKDTEININRFAAGTTEPFTSNNICCYISELQD